MFNILAQDLVGHHHIDPPFCARPACKSNPQEQIGQGLLKATTVGLRGASDFQADFMNVSTRPTAGSHSKSESRSLRQQLETRAR